MTKYTIEEINNVPHTVVTVDDVQPWEIAEADKIIDWRGVYTYIQGKYAHPLPSGAYVIGYALPPLPRNPTAEDAALIYLYSAHGLKPACLSDDGLEILWLGLPFTMHYGITNNSDREIRGWIEPHITHAVTVTGERVDIAIKE